MASFSSFASVLRGDGRRGDSRRAPGGPATSSSSPPPLPLHESPLNHVPALNVNSAFIDLRSVKADHTMKERNDFLIKDLGVGC